MKITGHGNTDNNLEFPYTSGIHTPVGNSYILYKGLFFRKVVYTQCDVTWFVE
jgi:hypothetical protein